MFGKFEKIIFKAIFGLILVINLTEAAKLGLVGAGLLLNSLTKSMVVPLPGNQFIICYLIYQSILFIKIFET